MTSHRDIAEGLLAWFAREKAAAPSVTENYIDAAGLDSFDMVELVAFAEQAFGVTFATGDLASPRFTSIDGLAAIIAAHLAKGGTA